jgi:Autotransporter beta-domain
MPMRIQKKPTANQLLTWAIGGFLAFALNLADAAPAAALLCSTADPTTVPAGTVLNTIPSDTINSILGLTATPPFLTGSTSYTLTNSQPFITARTFVFNPNLAQSGAVGSFTLPLAQLRGLTREQYLDFFALPNLPNAPRNNAIALVVFPAGTQFWSGPTGPITDPSTGLFWGSGGGLQYFVGRQVTGSFQVPPTNYIFPTPDNGGPVLVYGPRLSGNAGVIGSYLDQRCVAAYSDLDRVLTSLDVLSLANPTNAGPLAAAVGQLSPDRYGALPLIIGRQHALLLDVFGGRLDATRWPYADPDAKQRAIPCGVLVWGRALADFGKRDDSSTMPGYRTNTVGGLAGVGYDDCDGHVFGIGGGILSSSTNWNDLAGSTGNIRSGVIGAYGSTRYGALLIDGAAAGTYSLINVNRQIAIPDAGLGIPDLSTAISRTAYGTTEAPGLAARLDFGTSLHGNRAAMKPFVGVSYSRLDRRGFSETNAGGIDLTVDDKISDSLRSRLGAVGYYELMPAGPFALALQGNLVWTHRLSASSSDITAGFVGQPGAFTIVTVQDDRDSLQPGFAVIGRSALGQVFARYDGDFRQNFTAHTVAAGAAFKF